MSDKVLVIAEIGSNHDGDLGHALDLIDVAADCGADVAKFQSFLAEEMLAPSHPNYPMLKKLEMPRAWYPKLMERCASRGVRFLSTATNFTSLAWMEEYGAWGYKVASCNITYEPLLEYLIRINKPIIISTGMATLEEILALSRRLGDAGMRDYAFLHCVSRYPVPATEMRLRNITVLKEILPCKVGLSDHSWGMHLAVAAVALGARIVEKHLTNNKQGYSPDHHVSILPDEFSRMVQAIRETEAALVANFAPDVESIHTMRRSLHFARSMQAGEEITAADLKVTRPEDGLLPGQQTAVIGRRLAQPVATDQPLSWDLFEAAK